MIVTEVKISASVKRVDQFQSAECSADLFVRLDEGDTYKDAFKQFYPELSRLCDISAKKRLDHLLGKLPDTWGNPGEPVTPTTELKISTVEAKTKSQASGLLDEQIATFGGTVVEDPAKIDPVAEKTEEAKQLHRDALSSLVKQRDRIWGGHEPKSDADTLYRKWLMDNFNVTSCANRDTGLVIEVVKKLSKEIAVIDPFED